MNIELKKNYYKYINTTDINHYRLLILTEEYINISKNYVNKYPNASSWINLNKEYIICSDYFENFYVKQNYHYGQCAENVIKNIITDIRNIEK